MKISYNWLKDYVKDLKKPEELADLLTMHSFEVEEVKEIQLQNSKTEKDYILDFDILPNRAHDCLSYLGIAGECGAVLNKKLKKPEIKLNQKSTKASEKLSLEVNNSEDCPRYSARVIENVKVEESPAWLKERLQVCGINSINNIVDIANYVMLEYGQPLHAFDFNKIETEDDQNRKKLIVRRAKKGEKITALDEGDYELDDSILVIADNKKPLCIAGIKGGKGPEVDESTETIVLESANFDPVLIRKASQKLNLRTDASWRFENEIDPNLTEEAIDRTAYLIQKVAQGEVLKDIIDFYPKKRKPTKIKLETAKVQSLSGVKISTSQIASLLKRLELGVEKQKDFVMVTIPTFRLDLNLPQDLIEEVVRLYGLEKIEAELPDAAMIPPERNEAMFYQNKVQDLLVGLGFDEVYNYSFISDFDKEILNQVSEKTAELLKPASRDRKYLRPCLGLNLIKTLAFNKRYFDEIKLFEIGKVFKLENKNLKETRRLGAVVSFGNNGKQAEEFYFLKGVIESLFGGLGIAGVWFDDKTETSDEFVDSLHNPSRKAEIQVEGDVFGRLGEVSGKVSDKLELKQKAAFFEIDFDKLSKLATEERVYAAPSKYPSVVRDLAVLVPWGIKTEEVMNLIHTAGGELIRDIDLFDIYQGKGVAEGMKSLAFHIVFQSYDRTLTDDEVNQMQNKIIQALEDKGWEVRR